MASNIDTEPKSIIILEELEQPILDHRKYLLIRICNGIQALIVRDPHTDKASAALAVGVGSFSDEEDMPGLAHAVEHALFMGTKKFPQENDYTRYLASVSGHCNAYTWDTTTTFYFEVAAKPANDEEPTEDNPSPLLGALDRFSRFFIDPLFRDERLDNELKVVDSEHKKNLQNDVWREEQLERGLSNPNHPYCRFTTGNYELLKTEPEARGIDVRSKFMEFYRKNYSANQMTLVVFGREELKVLQRWTEELFSPIINQNLPQNRWEDELPFRPEDMGTQTFAKSVMDKFELQLAFQFIDEESMYGTQSSEYISHLIGHEGSGSILFEVKRRGWVDSLSAGSWLTCPGSPSIFRVAMQLTEEGLANYHKVIETVLEYTSMLRDNAPEKWIYDELKRIGEVDFMFKEQTRAGDFTLSTSSMMQRPIRREWILSGPRRMRTFDPEAITRGLAKLFPENMRISIFSKQPPVNCNMKEKWYGTEYRHEKIPKAHMIAFQEAAVRPSDQRNPGLHLPHKNEFIPQKLDVEKKELTSIAIGPRLLRDDDHVRVWWKKDEAFREPRANVNAKLKSPLVAASSRNLAMATLYTDLVRDSLKSYAYDAELAGLQYRIAPAGCNIIIEISGYNDQLSFLLERVVSAMRDLEIRPERFGIAKELAARSYKNQELKSPYIQVGHYLNYLNSDREFLIEEMAAELPHITAEDVRSFQKQMLVQMYMEIFCNGNMYKEDALKAANLIESTFKPLVLSRSQHPIVRSTTLPAGSNFVYNKTLADPANVNHCVETWLYVGDKADRILKAKTALFGHMACEPGFHQLRTKEQLGYMVFTGARSFKTTTGLRILIQSERTPDYLDSRIEAFLVMMGHVLEEMSDETFEGQKRSLIIKQLEKPKNLNQESNRDWEQIAGEFYDFDGHLREAELVESLTKADMGEFYNNYINPASLRRARISVHLHAQRTGELDSKIISVLRGAGLTDVPPKKRQSLHLAEQYIRERAPLLGEDKVASIMEDLEKAGLTQTATEDCCDVIEKACEIKDIRKVKAAFMTSAGAQPVKDMSEYW